MNSPRDIIREFLSRHDCNWSVAYEETDKLLTLLDEQGYAVNRKPGRPRNGEVRPVP